MCMRIDGGGGLRLRMSLVPCSQRMMFVSEEQLVSYWSEEGAEGGNLH